jgi:hypothetical protein
MRSPRVRYAVASAAMLAMVIAFCATLVRLAPESADRSRSAGALTTPAWNSVPDVAARHRLRLQALPQSHPGSRRSGSSAFAFSIYVLAGSRYSAWGSVTCVAHPRNGLTANPLNGLAFEVAREVDVNFSLP